MEENKTLGHDILNLLPADESGKIAYMIENKMNPFEPHPIRFYFGVSQHKSIWRAMRRGKCSVDGSAFARRPYNNRKPTRGRKQQELARGIYGQYRAYLRRIKAAV